MLSRIAALKDKASLAEEVARLHGIGAPGFFSAGVLADQKDTTRHLYRADQGGLGLPDRDYYLKTDTKSDETRKAYRAHITRMFELIGESKDTAF